MRISAKVDYALRAMLELAAVEGQGPVKGDRLAELQDIPVKFLETILGSMRSAGLVASQRGADGGYWLARPASAISVADVIRAVEGPLANVRGTRPDELELKGAASALQEVWIALRANLRSVLEEATLAQVAAGDLPPEVRALAGDPDAWRPH